MALLLHDQLLADIPRPVSRLAVQLHRRILVETVIKTPTTIDNGERRQSRTIRKTTTDNTAINREEKDVNMARHLIDTTNRVDPEVAVKKFGKLCFVNWTAF